MRINKYISKSGYCSRRHADALIEAGQVTINGERAELGAQVNPGDKVVVEGKQLALIKRDELVYIAFNKPAGIICTSNPKVKNNIIDYIDYPERIYTIGRLDQDSRGLILLTNDGNIVNPIIHARNQHSKEYRVRVEPAITDEFLQQMESGVEILDTVTLPARSKKINNHEFLLEIRQGLNRQIRRMCAALGYEVVDLKRTRIMDIELGNLKEGQWRYLSSSEINKLKSLEDNTKHAADHNPSRP